MSNSVKISFSKQAIDNAIGLKDSNSEVTIKLDSNVHAKAIADYHVDCVQTVLDGSRICVDIPYFGEYCFNLPVELPIGAEVAVCLDIITRWGIPTGAKIYVKYNGEIIYEVKIGF